MSFLKKILKTLGGDDATQYQRTVPIPSSEEDEAKAKINKAIEIIKSNKVCENAAYLINEFHSGEFGEIKYAKKKGSDVAAKDLDQKEWFKVDTLVRYEFAGKNIELVALNMHNWGAEFGDRSESGTFLVRFNGSTVLETSCSKKAINEAYDRAFFVNAYPNSLATFKVGEWMSDLEYLVRQSGEEKARLKLLSEKREREELKARAGRIELG